MALSVSKVLFFILSCGLWVADARLYTSILTVPNGARWGRWGPAHFCSKGHAVGFQIKIEPFVMESDQTGMNAIALLCDDGETITSTIGPKRGRLGPKSNKCAEGYICGIQTRVQSPQYVEDDTALNDVKMFCCD
ncbi:vitelline membrane outer layer protein 1-like [Tiliqua scincoides]|uniref:vitelline membrane outer layer protein 1-like n=1 Tax=Tiliqua scincoides TaxID=71010 RepID=UPI003461E410